MQIRASRISASIAQAITEDCGDEHLHGDGDAPASNDHVESVRQQSDTTPLLQSPHGSDTKVANGKPKKRSWRSLAASFFALFRLHLTRYRPASFRALRQETWLIDENEYLRSFPTPIRRRRDAVKQGRAQGEGQLVPAGDLGYSGSTFFSTPNGKFLVKSLPRRFEHSFFTHDLLDPYIAHNGAYPASLLVRILEMPYTKSPSLGGIIGTAPTHHIVMENLLYGRGDGEQAERWETYDLKPDDYFFPERDIADGNLVPQSVKDRLIDSFPGKVVVPLDDREQLLATLNIDTQLLASRAAVDYSLFLVRYPQPSSSDSSATPPVPSLLRSGVPCPWREGVDDVRGKWTYRAVVLDFFWAKSALQAKAMTGLVGAYNLVANQGPMSITAEPGEYRTRFMKMVDDLIIAETDTSRF